MDRLKAHANADGGLVSVGVQVSAPFLKGNTVGKDSIFGMKRVGASLRQAFIDHDSYLLK